MTADELNAWMRQQRADTKAHVLPQYVAPDGFTVSIQASNTHYCAPRETGLAAYHSVELGYPSAEEELLLPYAEDPERPTDTVYGWVPVEVVAAVLTSHGA